MNFALENMQKSSQNFVYFEEKKANHKKTPKIRTYTNICFFHEIQNDICIRPIKGNGV